MSSTHSSCALRLAGAFAVMVSLMGAGSAAHAAPAEVTIDSRSPSLDERDEGGWTSDLGFTNLTNADLTLKVAKKNASDAGCDPSLDKVELLAAEHQAVVVTIPGRCEVTDDGFAFTVSALRADQEVAKFEVLAGPKPAPTTPDWNELKIFAWLLLPLIFVALVAAGLVAYFLRGKTLALKNLEASWSFTDSWVSNLTFIAAFSTAIFGSAEVVKVALGENADSSIALATVGGAVAAAFAGAGPLILIALKNPNDGTYSVLGLLFAAAMTLAGALGELWILDEVGGDLNLGGTENFLTGALVIAAVLILAYALSTLYQLLKEDKPTPEEVSDTIKAAEMIVKALLAAADAQRMKEEATPGSALEAQADQAAQETFAEATEATAVALTTVTHARVRPRRRAAIL